MTQMFIYKEHDRLFPYTVLAEKEWPWGRIVTVAATHWGAKRAARREIKKLAKGTPTRALVSVVE